MTDARASSAASVGVVVIGRNEGERLVACFRSLAELGLHVVYVDSGSTDGSQAAARELGVRVVELDLSLPFTAARARVVGGDLLISEAPDLKYIQYIDGDCVLAPGWIHTASAFLDSSPDYAVVCGRRRERTPDRSPYNRMADLEWNTPVGDAQACGGDGLFRIFAYRSVGGFDSSLMAGEEPELCARLREAGWRIRRLAEEMTVHDAAMTRLSQWWSRAVRSGFGYAQTWRATRTRKHPLYTRELVRAAAWTAGPPLGSMLGAMLHPGLLLFAPLAYLAQVARLSIRFGAGSPFSWQRAGLLTLGKIAETWGALRYVKRAMVGVAGQAISYK